MIQPTEDEETNLLSDEYRLELLIRKVSAFKAKPSNRIKMEVERSKGRSISWEWMITILKIEQIF